MVIDINVVLAIKACSLLKELLVDVRQAPSHLAGGLDSRTRVSRRYLALRVDEVVTEDEIAGTIVLINRSVERELDHLVALQVLSLMDIPSDLVIIFVSYR